MTADGDGAGAPSRDEHSHSQDRLTDIESRLQDLEAHIEDRTVHRDQIEQSLKRYVRKRQRRGHARGWGPYLVLLYGTLMTLGAFHYLSGIWAILAMIVLWLSTLGLYTLMVIVGIGISVLEVPGRLRDWIQQYRN